MTAYEFPMFPLGSVLLPSMLLPLHIFEERYRTMMDRVMDSEVPGFGVVLIERGHEVGGEDQRSNIGTLARVLNHERAADGRWGVLAVGVERIRVNEWLPDDPFPRAIVESWDDESQASEAETADYLQLCTLHRRLLALTSELGYDVGQIPDLTEDPTLGSFQLAATAPISSFDRQRLLAAPTVADRLPLLAETLNSAMAIVEMEMGQSLRDE
ncbi:MAG: hypothetical protein HKN03_13850 [Acidimicrobiales bacterium]|nr:hypothetical protein [Acidimicrobiales bacterium]